MWILPVDTANIGKGKIKYTVNPEFCLDYNGLSSNPIAMQLTVLAKCDNGDKSATEWIFEKNGMIKVATNPNYCLHLEGGNQFNSARLMIFNCDGRSRQIWTIS
jgi:hypothetical protein